MKFDLYTKFVLSVIAVLLGLNLLFMTDIFSTKKVSASNTTIFQVGKTYYFYKDYDQIAFGKFESVDENGWARLYQYSPQLKTETPVLVNTRLMTTASQIEEKK